jgi:glycosyltransferase involved in cell wall biosynthesis
MRIVMLTDDVQIDRRILQEADSLIELGHEVILLAGWQENYPEFELIGQVKVQRLHTPQFPWRLKILYRLHNELIRGLNWLSRLGQRLLQVLSMVWQKGITLLARGLNLVVRLGARALLWRGLRPHELAILESLKRYRPDVIHAHDLPQLRAAVAAKRRLAVPLVYDAHELYPEQPRLTERQRRGLRKLEKAYILDADRVITVNPFLEQEMARRYKHPAVAVIQNAMRPPATFDPTRRYDLFRQEYGLSAAQILILYQGYIAPERNLEVIVQGMQLVRDDRFVLLIMGYGAYAEHLQALAQEAEVSSRVVFVPSKSQDILLSYTASADIGLIPYPYGRDFNTHYVSPNKLYEFIIAGLPILTNDLPYVRQVVEEYGFGVCADLQTAVGFAGAVSRYPLDNLARYRHKLAEHRQQFLWQTEAEKLGKLYRDLPLATMHIS